MHKEEKDRKNYGGRGAGALFVVGIGPGGLEHLTSRAREALKEASIVVGYTRYVGLVKVLIEGKEVYSTGMTHEVERCKKAVELALQGRSVAIISSGDAGIYGMAGLALQLLDGAKIKVEVVPGVPAFVAAAALLGAPLMHDFASISLSDLLTEWETIEKRLEAAAKADFVIILYNPKSSERVEGLGRAVDIIRGYRGGATPVGLVRNATRQGESVTLTTLEAVQGLYDSIDMLSILIIGNSTTFSREGWMVTPRGYRGV